jgi:hypothetical protein
MSQQTLQERIAAAMANKQAAAQQAEQSLINNEAYVNYLADKYIEKAQIDNLDNIINSLNVMKPIIASDGTRYAVHVYPVDESTLGCVMSRVLAIVWATNQMFTTERQKEFELLTKLNFLITKDCANELGRPAYFKDTSIVTEEPYGDYGMPLLHICTVLGIENNLTNAMLDKYFAKQLARAEKKLEEHMDSELVDTTTFVVVD